MSDPTLRSDRKRASVEAGLSQTLPKRARQRSSQQLENSEKEIHRDLSPKRLGVSPDPSVNPADAIFNNEELFLHILENLGAQDLVRAERVSRYWSRICRDQQLWKRLYLSSHSHPSLYRPSGSSTKRAPVPVAPSTIRQTSNCAPADVTSSAFASFDQESESGEIDWKTLVKISTNWSTGNATLHSLSPSPGPSRVHQSPASRHTPIRSRPELDVSNVETPSKSRPPKTATASTLNPSEPPEVNRDSRDHILGLSPAFIFVAYPSSPLLHVYPSTSTSSAAGNDGEDDNELSSTDLTEPITLIPPPPGWSTPSSPDLITAIAVDEDRLQAGKRARSEPARVVVWYSSGGFVVIEATPTKGPDATESGPGSKTVQWRRIVINTDSETLKRRSRKRRYIAPSRDPVVLGAFHGSLLIACTRRFFMSFYLIEDGAEGQHAQLLQTLHSDVSHHPASLSLRQVVDRDDAYQFDEAASDISVEPHPNDSKPSYLASLAYCSPLYPNSWTLAVQRIFIDLRESDTSETVRCDESWAVARTYRKGSSIPSRSWPFRPRGEIVGVKGKAAVGIGANDRWGVLAGNDNQVQVYRLPTVSDLEDHKADSPEHARASTLKVIQHSQTLLAHASSLTSISLAGDRCVTSGNDGRVLVWDLSQEAMITPSNFDNDNDSAATKDDNLEYVEVRSTGRSLRQDILPVPPVRHPLSLATAAQEYLSKDSSQKPIVQDLAFNQDTIVGLVRENQNDSVVRVWKFDK